MKAKILRRDIVPVAPTSFAVAINRDGKVDKRFLALPRLGIYVISSGRRIIRLGECSSGARRFRDGFCGRLRIMRSGKERKNYAAYSWRDNYRASSVTVDYFELPEAFDNNALRRALEAELTFQLRIAKRRWPRDMSEIHFLERYRKNTAVVKQLRRILTGYRLRYNDRI